MPPGILLAINTCKYVSEMKSHEKDFRNCPGSSYKPSGSSSSKDNASTDSSVVSVDGNLAAEADVYLIQVMFQGLYRKYQCSGQG